jgi:rifampicin phosphotransferase
VPLPVVCVVPVAASRPPLTSIDDLLGPSLPSAAQVGGKGARLVWLAKHGFLVPKTWILPASAFCSAVRSGLREDHHPRALLADVGQRGALSRMGRARETLLSQPLTPELVQALDQLWTDLRDEVPWGLAVRSSATCEDAELTAMAGLATTVLGVRGVESLQNAVREVWASALLPRALHHLAARGLDDLAMAVVVQVVVRADASGVMFTRPPPGTDAEVWAHDERLINATFGLGAPIVNGAVAPDMIRIRASDRSVRDRTIATKRRALVVDETGPCYVDVPEGRVRAPALSEQVLSKLATLADDLERVEDAAHDVEFAVDGDELFVVQARPVVGKGFPEGGDETTVWSRANVGEALPGVATPLTWSVAQGFSERGFRQAFRSLGCTVPANAAMVTNVHGRFYLNLTAFARIAAQVPGLDPATLVGVGGGMHVPQLDEQILGVSRRGFYLRLPATASRLLVEQFRLSSRVERFGRRARRSHRGRRASQLRSLDDRHLTKAMGDVLRDLDRTGTLMLACASASLASHLALKTLLGWLSVEQPESTAQTLTAGVRDLESAKPGIAIARMAVLACQHSSVVEGVAKGSFKRIEDVPPGPVRSALEQFMEDFGDRAVREAEIATPRWNEDHAQVFAMLGAAIQNPNQHPEAGPVRARIRADRTMARLERELSTVQTAAVRILIVHSQKTTALRERMRAWVTRTLGAIRRVALEFDRRLRRMDPELEPGAAFFCTSDELITAIENGGADLRHLVRMRRAEHARDERRPDTPVTFIGRPPPVVLPPAGKTVLRGLPASAGVVEGKVRLLPAGRELEEGLEPGEILVARTTDVGLTPLFLLAAGVVTELGGPLSHAALVAREYGVPAVVNVAGATVALRTGERIRIDGDRGIVERLEVDDD